MDWNSLAPCLVSEPSPPYVSQGLHRHSSLDGQFYPNALGSQIFSLNRESFSAQSIQDPDPGLGFNGQLHLHAATQQSLSPSRPDTDLAGTQTIAQPPDEVKKKQNGKTQIPESVSTDAETARVAKRRARNRTASLQSRERKKARHDNLKDRAASLEAIYGSLVRERDALLVEKSEVTSQLLQHLYCGGPQVNWCPGYEARGAWWRILHGETII